MHHRLAAIHNNPLAIALAFDTRFGKTGFAHGVAHTGGERFGLAVGRTRGDDDALKKSRQLFGIKHADVLGLHVLQPIDDGALQFLDVVFFVGSGHQGVW